MKKTVKLLNYTILLSVLTLTWSYGDMVTLVSGNEIFGQVISEGVVVKLRTPTGSMDIPKNRIAKIVREKPDVTYAKFGKNLFDRKNYVLALDYYKLALEQAPGNEQYQSMVALCEKSLADTKTAEVEGYMATAQRYIEQNRLMDALDTYDSVTAMGLGEAWDTRAKQGMSKVYLLQTQGFLEPADREALVEKALNADPTNPEAHYEKGMVLLQKKQRTDALESFELSVNLDPNFAKGFKMLGTLYFEDKNYLKASENLEKLKALSKDLFSSMKVALVTCYTELGTKSFQAQNYDEANLWLEKAIELDPNQNWPVLWQTKYQLRKAETSPDNAEDQFSLGLWCLDKKMDQEALEHFKTAYAVQPGMYKARQKIREITDKFASSLYQSAVANLNSRNYQGAITGFQQLAQQYPDSSYTPDAKRLVTATREQWAEIIFRDSKAAYDAKYYDRALIGFKRIVDEFSDTNRFVDAQRFLSRTRTLVKETDTEVGERQQQMTNIDEMIASSYGNDSIAWTQIKGLSNLTNQALERALMNRTPLEKRLMRDNLDKVIYLFYDTDRGIDRLRPIAIRNRLPVGDRSKVRNDSDYQKILKLTLMILLSTGEDYQNAWLELAPYFGTSRSEVEDNRSRFGEETRRLLDDNAGEVYQLLNLRR